MKTYLAITRDHSYSMSSIARAAARDYNTTIKATQAAAELYKIPTFVSVNRCGGGVYDEEKGVDIGTVKPMAEGNYRCSGGTPLFRAVDQHITNLLKLPDADNPEVTFIVMATTDGHDTDGGGEELAHRIIKLQGTDRWTFVFRVPRGYARKLCLLGIAEGNILEWDQTERGVQAASAVNTAAFGDFYNARSTGTKSTKTFYSSMKDVTPAEVKAALKDISADVNLWPVSEKEAGTQIREFVEHRLKGAPMMKGAAFYQLVKTEDKIQDYKLIAIRDKKSNAIYCGPQARDMLGLPRVGDARVRPVDHGEFDVFVQSTSVNRKVAAGTQLLYWQDVGVTFKEGISAR